MELVLPWQALIAFVEPNYYQGCSKDTS